jgi:hypothetical protein
MLVTIITSPRGEGLEHSEKLSPAAVRARYLLAVNLGARRDV